MNLLIGSYSYYPNIGGLERITNMMAHAFQKQGHAVRIVTQTHGRAGADDAADIPVVRRPSIPAFLDCCRWADLLWHNNLSLRFGLPFLLTRKPQIITTQTFYGGEPAYEDWVFKCKRRFIKRFPHVILCSEMKRQFPDGVVIPNPFETSMFSQATRPVRDRWFVFVGRLVSDKGVDDLLQAVASLRERGVLAPVTIIGEGPEELKLRGFVERVQLQSLIHFTGALQGQALAHEISRHRCLVVPSRWREPYGIVALEGLACGCWVIGSAGGGLPEAIGPGGWTYPNGDCEALAGLLQRFIETGENLSLETRGQISLHLNQRTVEHIAELYLGVFNREILRAQGR
ncbi:MAG TPA: glycosyltransferase family 4 protein [Candidatus Ozemobacteraceae bacterium]|nr:glycosyltransferase family 4 protein [Candidatus Ozemobacteraceae bacterium]